MYRYVYATVIPQSPLQSVYTQQVCLFITGLSYYYALLLLADVSLVDLCTLQLLFPWASLLVPAYDPFNKLDNPLLPTLLDRGLMKQSDLLFINIVSSN
jgi:hypothetical protein